MRKVSDASIQALKNYQDRSFETASEIGSTALSLQQSVADWMRGNPVSRHVVIHE